MVPACSTSTWVCGPLVAEVMVWPAQMAAAAVAVLVEPVLT
jgi:hypothetical protein